MIRLEAVVHPETLYNAGRRPRADRALGVPNRVGQFDLFAVGEERLRVAEDVGVERIGHFVANALNAAADFLAFVDSDQKRVQIQVVEVPGSARHLRQKVGASDDLIKRPRSYGRKDFAHFLRVEREQIHDFFRRSRESHPKAFVLRAHADRTSVRVALPDHDAAHRDKRGSAYSELLGAEHGRNYDILAGSKSAIGSESYSVPQVVKGQNLVRLRETDLPRQPGEFDRRRGRRPGSAVVPRHENDIRLGLGDAAGDGADPARGNQLDRDLRARIDLLQVVNQLRKIFYRVDVVVRRRRNQ